MTSGDSILQLSRHIQVACVAGGLLDHVQDYPAKIGDALIWPVEGTLGQQGRVQVARSS